MPDATLVASYQAYRFVPNRRPDKAFTPHPAVGAYCGGMMLTLGLAYNYVALPAALLSFAAMSSLLLYGRYKRQQAADSPVLAKPLG